MQATSICMLRVIKVCHDVTGVLCAEWRIFASMKMKEERLRDIRQGDLCRISKRRNDKRRLPPEVDMFSAKQTGQISTLDGNLFTL